MNDIITSFYNQISDNVSTVSKMQYYNAVWNYVLNISLSRFVWKFPETVYTSNFIIEKSLLETGYIALFKDDTTDKYYMLPGFGENFNILNEPVNYCLNLSGDTSNIENIIGTTHTDFVICYNSLSHIFNNTYLSMLIDDIAETMYQQHILYSKLRQPYIITTSDKKMFNDKQLFNKIIQRDVVFTDDIENIKLLNLEIQHESFNNLQDRLDDLMRRMHGILGLSYDVDAKRERLITDEQSARNEIKDHFRESMLKARVEFCNNVKKHYNIEINVECTI